MCLSPQQLKSIEFSQMIKNIAGKEITLKIHLRSENILMKIKLKYVRDACEFGYSSTLGDEATTSTSFCNGQCECLNIYMDIFDIVCFITTICCNLTQFFFHKTVYSILMNLKALLVIHQAHPNCQTRKLRRLYYWSLYTVLIVYFTILINTIVGLILKQFLFMHDK